MTNLTHNEIVQRLCQSGFSTYLVGGAIRDMFAGFDPSDFDITTSATPEQIFEVFSDRNVDTFGKTFGVTVVDGVDVATFRTDQYPNGNGAKNCQVRYATDIHSDLARRDFTINSLALCPITGDVIDDFNGRQDLQRRVLRFVGDAQARINEDPNRIVRACRFVAKFHASFAPETLEALIDSAHLVRDAVDPERIGIEIKKALLLPEPSLFFSALEVVGALQFVFPGIEKCVDHVHGRFHTETVWEHMLLACDKVSKKFPLVRLAALLHDCGKPEAFLRENGESFTYHEHISADLVDTWLSHLRFSNENRDFVRGLVRLHMWGSIEELSARAVRCLLFRLHELGVDIPSWFRLCIADRHANVRKNDFTFAEIKQNVQRLTRSCAVADTPMSVNALTLKGGDIIRVFGINPSPLVGQVQHHLLEFVLENGNECNQTSVLIEEAHKFLSSVSY